MSMVDIGERLKQAREKKGVTIGQVQKQTLIHTTVLVALEEGKCDDILTSTYVKSFLKKYAGYLGLDSKEVLNEYLGLHAGQPAPAQDLKKIEKPNSKKNDFKVPVLLLRRVVLAAVAIFILALILSFAVSGIRFLSSWSKRHHSQGKAVIKNKNNNRLEKVASKKNAEKNTVKNTSRPSEYIVPKETALEVVLKVKAPVWVEVKKDGEKIFRQSLPKGFVKSITAREKVDLYVAKGDRIEIILNGNSLGSPGKGVIKDLEVTRSGMKVKQ